MSTFSCVGMCCFVSFYLFIYFTNPSSTTGCYYLFKKINWRIISWLCFVQCFSRVVEIGHVVTFLVRQYTWARLLKHRGEIWLFKTGKSWYLLVRHWVRHKTEGTSLHIRLLFSRIRTDTWNSDVNSSTHFHAGTNKEQITDEMNDFIFIVVICMFTSILQCKESYEALLSCPV